MYAVNMTSVRGDFFAVGLLVEKSGNVAPPLVPDQHQLEIKL